MPPSIILPTWSPEVAAPSRFRVSGLCSTHSNCPVAPHLLHTLGNQSPRRTWSPDVAAPSRLSVSGLCSTSLVRRSTSSELVALISRHWQERGICGGSVGQGWQRAGLQRRSAGDCCDHVPPMERQRSVTCVAKATTSPAYFPGIPDKAGEAANLPAGPALPHLPHNRS